jgi:hypothetical protein
LVDFGAMEKQQHQIITKTQEIHIDMLCGLRKVSTFLVFIERDLIQKSPGFNDIEAR